MKSRPSYLPCLPSLASFPFWMTIFAVVVMAMHGPIAQLQHYHEFADQSMILGINHAADVLTNAGFAVVALFGMFHLFTIRKNGTASAASKGFYGYCLFIVSLFLTTLGSGYYHLAPSDARLFWDRLPIALACAGILAAVRAETVDGDHVLRDLGLFSGAAIFSVLWWQQTGDLRAYLLLQLLTLILIPLWQMIHQSALKDRLAFGAAILLYIAAKVAELHDVLIQQSLNLISGHSLKHLLAAAAGAMIVARLMQRTKCSAYPAYPA